MKRPLAYITAPWGNNEFENTETAARYCRAVYWNVAGSPVLKCSITNERLAQAGYYSILARYESLHLSD